MIDHVSMNYCALLSSFNFPPLITSTSQTLLLSDATVKICLTLSLIYQCEVGFKYRHYKKNRSYEIFLFMSDVLDDIHSNDEVDIVDMELV